VVVLLLVELQGLLLVTVVVDAGACVPRGGQRSGRVACRVRAGAGAVQAGHAVSGSVADARFGRAHVGPEQRPVGGRGGRVARPHHVLGRRRVTVLVGRGRGVRFADAGLGFRVVEAGRGHGGRGRLIAAAAAGASPAAAAATATDSTAASAAGAVQLARGRGHGRVVRAVLRGPGLR